MEKSEESQTGSVNLFVAHFCDVCNFQSRDPRRKFQNLG